MDDLNFSLVVTLVENKYCTENKCVKKVNTSKEQGSSCEQRSRFIFRRLTPEKSLKIFTREYTLAVTFIIS